MNESVRRRRKRKMTEKEKSEICFQKKLTDFSACAYIRPELRQVGKPVSVHLK